MDRIDEALTRLPDWYGKNARDLPWRSDREPYHVWISEIMLQQTRVEAVRGYYLRFLEVLPSVESLAACGEEDLLKLWEGLGYYSRARNLRKAAQTIMTDYDGRFPDSYDQILSLSGIGPYTAGAISSIAFGLPHAAVDGNVLRVLSRLTDDERNITDTEVKRDAAARIEAWMRHHTQADPGIISQALMELGALCCVPNGLPHCGECPWQSFCLARENGTIEERPVKSGRKPRRTQERTILMITDGTHLVLSRRPQEGLLAGMYEPVNLEGWIFGEEIPRVVRKMGFSPLRVIPLRDARHIFTHIEWKMRGFLVRVEETAADAVLPEGMIYADRDEIGKRYAVPSAFRAYMGAWDW